ncbi:MAG TPA: type VI secretion system tube protein Hcp [Tepidisphaeraceae bacterium]|nr:type VI secretion system tube protein Hcp [Tepidisphaeraceae bacterium]
MAAVDYFLKIDGIDGESPDAKHPNEIQIMSWSFGETQAGSHSGGGGGGAGKVVMQDFNFTMHTNKASPKLFLACANGEHIKSAKLTCRKAGKEQQEFLLWTFSDLLVSSYQTGGSEGSSVLPVDSISLNFAKVEIGYKPQKADGTLDAENKAGYDLKKNQKV